MDRFRQTTIDWPFGFFPTAQVSRRERFDPQGELLKSAGCCNTTGIIRRVKRTLSGVMNWRHLPTRNMTPQIYR